MKHTDYRIAWICALPTEAAAAHCMLDERHASLSNLPQDDNNYVLGRTGEHNVVIAVLPAGITGTISAAQVAEKMRFTFPSIKFGLMVGIGGGAPSDKHDIRLGDIVVSTPMHTSGGVVQYDFGKSIQDKRFVRTGSLNKPPEILLKAMTSLQARHMYDESQIPKILRESAERYPRWQASIPPDRITDQLFNHDYQHPLQQPNCAACDPSQLKQRPARLSNDPVIHYGLIASGNQVMRNGAIREQLRSELDILCFEMEAAGLTDALPCLVIRGICDYADTHKHKIWQDYAAATAAAYAKELLSFIPGEQTAPTARVVEPEEQRHFLVPKNVSQKHIIRQDLLSSLEKHLNPESVGRQQARRVALVGMGGSGKSELAVWFAQAHRNTYRAVLWMDCSSEVDFQYSCLQVAQKLSSQSFTNSSASQAWLQDWLCAYQDWLLITDSLDDATMQFNIKSNFLSVGMTGDVLATSRDFDLGISWTEIKVSKMLPLESLDLLRQFVGNHSLRNGNGDHNLTSVSLELGFLAIAIDHAGHYMQQQAMTAEEYLSLLRQAEPKSSFMISRQILHPPSLWAAFDLSFQKLNHVDPLACTILFLFALLESEAIDLDLIIFRESFQGYWAVNGTFEEVPADLKWMSDELEVLLRDRYELLAMVTKLRRFAFVQLNEHNMVISLHPLVQKWVHNKLDHEPKLAGYLKRCTIGLVSGKLSKQDLFPPYILESGGSSSVEERKLRSWPWRQYHHLSKHALRCFGYVCNSLTMNEVTVSQSLALLQILEYTAYGDHDQHQELKIRVLNAIEETLDDISLDQDKFLNISVVIWKLLSARSCQCRDKSYDHQQLDSQIPEDEVEGLCATCKATLWKALPLNDLLLSDKCTPRVTAVVACLSQTLLRVRPRFILYSSHRHIRDIDTNIVSEDDLGLDINSGKNETAFDDCNDKMLQLQTVAAYQTHGNRGQEVLWHNYRIAPSPRDPLPSNFAFHAKRSEHGDLKYLVRHHLESLKGRPRPAHDEVHIDTVLFESWIGKYLLANQDYEQAAIRCPKDGIYMSLPDTRHIDQSYTAFIRLEEAVELFKSTAGCKSDEYRRCLWHLTKYWQAWGQWANVIDSLLPLVQESIRNPVSDWTHERCIISLIHALQRTGKVAEARNILSSVRKAYESQGETLRTLLNSDDLLKDRAMEVFVNKNYRGREFVATRNPWQIFVMTLNGTTLTFEAFPTKLVHDVLLEMEERSGSNPNETRLIYGGKQLEPHRMLSDYGIQDGSTLHEVLRLQGGRRLVSE